LVHAGLAYRSKKACLAGQALPLKNLPQLDYGKPKAAPNNGDCKSPEEVTGIEAGHHQRADYVEAAAEKGHYYDGYAYDVRYFQIAEVHPCQCRGSIHNLA